MGEILSGPIGVIGAIILGLLLIIICILGTWKKVPNDHAAVVVGIGKPKVVTAGGTVVIPLLQRMDTITLETIPLNVIVRGVKTQLGVPINADGYVIIKVHSTDEDVLTAMQMFYCNNEEKTKQKITEQTQKLCEGKLREIVSGMTVETIYDDREEFSKKVQEVASTALASIGLELKSFTINDITDEDEYIESLGKAQIAKVKADAAIAQAEATREQQIKTAEAQRLGKQAQITAETQISESEKEKNMKVLEYTREQERKRAESDAAYEIQKNITQREVTNTEMDATILKEQRTKEAREAAIQVEIAAEQKNIELAIKQAERKEAELQATVVKPAEASRKEMEIKAGADKVRRVLEAEAASESTKLAAGAEAERIKQQGFADAEISKAKGLAEAEVIEKCGRAEAESIRQKGLAEAEALDKKAEALAKMNDAGKIQMVIEKLPEIARAIAEPMSRIGNMTIIGGGSGDGSGGATDVTRMALGSLKALTEGLKDTVGFDLNELMRANTFEGKTTKNLNISIDGSPDEESKDAIVQAVVASETYKDTEGKDTSKHKSK